MSDEEIVIKYSDMVYKIAFQQLRNRTNAEDVFSEVFLKYFKKKRTFNDEEHRKAWLIRVTINTAKDYFLSSEYKNTFLSEEVLSMQSHFDNMESFELFDVVSRLKPEYLIVIHLFYYEDMPIKKIAEALQMNENTVKTNLSRAKQQIKRELEASK